VKNTKRWDKVFSTCSWLLVFILLYAAVFVVLTPIGVNGPVAQLIGVAGAEIFYTVLYTAEAIILAFSKWRKKKKLRKHVLMVIYLVGLFTGFLSVSLIGFNFLAQWDNILTALIAAGCWLYWTFKTEYIHPEQFTHVIENME
jgi:hypothetical protein